MKIYAAPYLTVLMFILLLSKYSESTEAITPSTPLTAADEDGWYLVFEDDFDSKVLNEDYWTACDDGVNYNGEEQYYKPENVSQKNGSLLLTAENEPYDETHPYTSGKVTTEGKVSFHYGKIEIRAKFPTDTGFFPAIWLLPVEKETDPTMCPLPEIDIFEYVGNGSDSAYAVYHYRDENGKQQQCVYTYPMPVANEFHTYTLIWTPEYLEWYVDDVLVFSIDENVPTEPMFLNINLAVSGNWFPPPDETTDFPASFEIDYVRYYKNDLM